MNKRIGEGMISNEPIFTFRAELANILDVGKAPLGHRRVVNILGGTVTGARMTGRVLPGGADWQIVAPDGMADLHARYTLESDAGALVQVESKGMRHAPADILARLGRGEDVDPSLYYFRTVMRFETAHPTTAWLNKIMAIARGARERNAVKLEVYEVL
jgi:hypothetical protein